MAKYYVKSRVFCTGHLYEIGDECSEEVATALGKDEVDVVGAVASEHVVSPRDSKPIKKASIKSK